MNQCILQANPIQKNRTLCNSREKSHITHLDNPIRLDINNDVKFAIPYKLSCPIRA